MGEVANKQWYPALRYQPETDLCPRRWVVRHAPDLDDCLIVLRSQGLRVARMAQAVYQDIGKRSLNLRYRDGFESITIRTITPLAFSYYKNHVGVWGWCHLRDDFRMFRLDRVEGIDPVELRKTIGPAEIIQAVTNLPEWQKHALNNGTRLMETACRLPEWPRK